MDLTLNNLQRLIYNYCIFITYKSLGNWGPVVICGFDCFSFLQRLRHVFAMTILWSEDTPSKEEYDYDRKICLQKEFDCDRKILLEKILLEKILLQKRSTTQSYERNLTSSMLYHNIRYSLLLKRMESMVNFFYLGKVHFPFINMKNIFFERNRKVNFRGQY